MEIGASAVSRRRRGLNLLPGDVGRPVDHIKQNLVIENLDQKIADAIDTVAPYEEEVLDREALVSSSDPTLHDRRQKS